MERPFTCITLEDFLAATPDYVIIDHAGRVWEILSRCERVGSMFVLWLRFSKDYTAEAFCYSHENGIVRTEDWGKDMILNHPETRIVPKIVPKSELTEIGA